MGTVRTSLHPLPPHPWEVVHRFAPRAVAPSPHQHDAFAPSLDLPRVPAHPAAPGPRCPAGSCRGCSRRRRRRRASRARAATCRSPREISSSAGGDSVSRKSVIGNISLSDSVIDAYCLDARGSFLSLSRAGTTTPRRCFCCGTFMARSDAARGPRMPFCQGIETIVVGTEPSGRSSEPSAATAGRRRAFDGS